MDIRTSRRFKFIINLVYFGIILLIAFFAMKYLYVILPFIIGIAIAFIVEPLVNYLEERRKITRKITGVVFPIIVWVVGIFLTVLISGMIINEVTGFATNFPEYVKVITDLFDQIKEWSESVLLQAPESVRTLLQAGVDKIPEMIVDLLQNWVKGLGTLLTSFITSLPSSLIFILVSIVSSCFISVDFPKIKAFVIRQVPERHKDAVLSIKGFINQVIIKLGKSYLLIILITFSELLVWFMILKVEYAVTLALVIAIFDILPIVGTGTILIPWALYNIAFGNLKFGIWLFVAYLFIMVVRQIIEPKIVGAQTGLHPVVTLVAMFVGLKLLGFAGVFLFPVALMFLKYMQDYKFFTFWKEGPPEEKKNKKNILQKIKFKK